MELSFRPDLFCRLLLMYYMADVSYCAHFGIGNQYTSPLVCGRNVQIHDIGAVLRHIPEGHHRGRCPPAPDELMREACDVCMCWSDSQCGPDQKCCYNGCMQTCLHKVKPPPVLDWLIEPTRGPVAKGNSWLIPGPQIKDTEETCSTSVQPDGESPLRCPTGYLCSIQDTGDPGHGKPNRGVCIKQN